MAHSSTILCGENTFPILTVLPPIEGSFSTRYVFTPFSAKASAAVIPAMPPPTTRVALVTSTRNSERDSACSSRCREALMRSRAFSVARFLSSVTHEHCSLIFVISRRYGFRPASRIQPLKV